jgi:regulatory protein YycH of two-component signal transduction system YycFG
LGRFDTLKQIVVVLVVVVVVVMTVVQCWSLWKEALNVAQTYNCGREHPYTTRKTIRHSAKRKRQRY